MAPTPEQRLHEAITGSPDLGSYPSTLADRLAVALDASFEMLEARGLLGKVTPIAGTAAGPYGAPSTLLADSIEQVRARYRFDDASKWRNLTEAVQQLAANLALLEQNPPTTPTTPGQPAPGPGSLPPGTTQGTLTWAADMSKADSSAAGFKPNLIQRQWGSGSIDTSRNPVPIGVAPDGSRGMKFALGAGQTRLEVQPPVLQSMKKGEACWLGFWFIGDAQVERTRDPWNIIAQWHGNDTTSPHQIIAVDGGDLITGNGKSLVRFYKDRVKAGKRYNVVTKVSADSRGSQSVWVNGELVLDNHPAGLNNTPLYLKLGHYRNPSGSPAQVMWLGGHRVATGYGEAYPR